MNTITVSDLSSLLDAEYEGNGSFIIKGMNSLSEANDNEITFIISEKYKDLLLESKASVVLAPKKFKGNLPEGKIYIYCDNPNITFGRIVSMFASLHSSYKTGIHPTAIIASGVNVPASCHIGANVVIESEVVLGENTIILTGTFIGEASRIGNNCIIYPHCVIREKTQIGNDVIIHSGVIIGSDGFGYETTPSGIIKIPQVGTVRIDDDVEIGANSAIDRARFGMTWIKKGVKIDNLVHVAHNVEVGEDSMLIAQSGIAGSSKIGNKVIVAGQAGVSHGVKVGDGAMISGQAGVTRDVPPNARWAGTPATSSKEYMKLLLSPEEVKRQKERINEIEKNLKLLEEELSKLKNHIG
ncbi:MAG TPA: UDP-3-O-(3-hydroxymyristoyl)glucosamine N-acyltransferase [Lentisphaeria bacterium]|nr:MAG: UDP-3-O-(3-hydroxymyristoyl)glucosamine N-acyltransferase [Lentisphaerae bacterium GWF2_38_69]HBM17515.1 UDP-3-O-(3-hydroxymyristoyl)glucosamine N-acyltransferase [Lentisphaeria bacterium]